MHDKRTCLVVGAGGFLGSYVCAALRDRHALVPASSNKARAGQSGWLHLDMTIPSTLHNLPDRMDEVLYLAQSPYYRDFPAQAEHVWEVNVQGVLRMLEYARKAGVRHFVLASSGSVYAPSRADLREDSPLDLSPSSRFYTRSKVAAELLLHAYSDYFSTISLRFFSLYGLGLAKGMLLERMVSVLIQGAPITLSGEDGFAFNPLHVREAAFAVGAALRLKGHHAINVAGPQVLTLGAACRAMGQALECAPNFVYAGEDWRMVADISRMCDMLCTPRINAVDGLAEYALAIRTGAGSGQPPCR